MWTEITKDLVTREAIEEMGYEYEETKWFFYIMDYLRYVSKACLAADDKKRSMEYSDMFPQDDVLRLTELSETIRCARKERVRDIQRERDWRDEWEQPFRRHHHDRPPGSLEAFAG